MAYFHANSRVFRRYLHIITLFSSFWRDYVIFARYWRIIALLAHFGAYLALLSYLYARWPIFWQPDINPTNIIHFMRNYGDQHLFYPFLAILSRLVVQYWHISSFVPFCWAVILFLHDVVHFHPIILILAQNRAFSVPTP